MYQGKIQGAEKINAVSYMISWHVTAVRKRIRSTKSSQWDAYRPSIGASFDVEISSLIGNVCTNKCIKAMSKELQRWTLNFIHCNAQTFSKQQLVARWGQRTLTCTSERSWNLGPIFLLRLYEWKCIKAGSKVLKDECCTSYLLVTRHNSAQIYPEHQFGA
jgi:hypothetical protein